MESVVFKASAELAAALDSAKRFDDHLLQQRIERLTAIIREHGLPLPEEDPHLGASDGDHLDACKKVVTAAYDLLEASETLERALAELRALVGSGMEFVGSESWRR